MLLQNFVEDAVSVCSPHNTGSTRPGILLPLNGPTGPLKSLNSISNASFFLFLINLWKLIHTKFYDYYIGVNLGYYNNNLQQNKDMIVILHNWIIN